MTIENADCLVHSIRGDVCGGESTGEYRVARLTFETGGRELDRMGAVGEAQIRVDDEPLDGWGIEAGGNGCLPRRDGVAIVAFERTCCTNEDLQRGWRSRSSCASRVERSNHGAQTIFQPFVRLNVSVLQKLAALRYHA